MVYNKPIEGLCDAILAVADGHNGTWASSVNRWMPQLSCDFPLMQLGQAIWGGEVSHSSEDSTRTR